MRTRAALCALLLLAAPAGAQQGTDDPHAVIAAVLAQEVAARGQENAAETCVSEGLAGVPLAPDGDDPMAPGGAVRIRPQWHVLPAPASARPAYTPPAPGERRRRRPRPEPVPPPTPLAADVAARLDTLWREATDPGRPMPPARGIAASDVPSPLHLQRPSDDCALLTLSAPVFAGDAAFIEIAYQCGSVCGNGNLYALERRAGRWEIVGIADTWIR